MLDKILTENFKRELEYTLKDIKHHQERIEEESFLQDEIRIKENLLAKIEPFSQHSDLKEDFLVAAIDGSGTESLRYLDDIRIHLFTRATIVLDSNCQGKSPFCPLGQDDMEVLLRAQPVTRFHWHTGAYQDVKKKFSESLEDFYPIQNTSDLILPFFRDYTGGTIRTLQDIGKSRRYAPHVKDMKSFESLLSRNVILSNSFVHEELRTVLEYAGAKEVLMSDRLPKYLLLDGAMYVHMHSHEYPSMPSGFMLREICALAREKGVVLVAVSKNHTIPFARRIARIARENFGSNSKWFCLLPSKNDPGGGLQIYATRTYIPPKLAVPYLFCFSGDNRPSRIDFDRIWWLQNIYVKDDPETTRENEKELFKELELMSRDARWYGYPVALALAHQACKLDYESLQIAKELTVEAGLRIGLGTHHPDEPRTDYNL